MSPLKLGEIVVDCENPAKLAEFWAQVTQAQASVRSDSWASVDTSPLLCFQKVPEPRRGKNRVHLDWEPADIDATMKQVHAAGGVTLNDFRDAQGRCVVMADIEGNEFCLVGE